MSTLVSFSQISSTYRSNSPKTVFPVDSPFNTTTGILLVNHKQNKHPQGIPSYILHFMFRGCFSVSLGGFYQSYLPRDYLQDWEKERIW